MHKTKLDFLRNFIGSLKWPFLASLLQNFSTICLYILSKFYNKSAQKGLIFPNQAKYARSLILFFLVLFFLLPCLLRGAEGAKVLAANKEGKLGPDKNEDFIDTRLIRDFVESRNLIECRQKCGQLVLAGDIRAKWSATNENVAGKNLRGARASEGNINAFKSEFNLFMDYTTKNSWVSTKLRWSVRDAVDGAFKYDVKTDLDRAFIGYDVFECGDEDFYIEIGRSKLDYMFESRVEFNSNFNGIHLYYTNKYPTLGTMTLHGGPFVISFESNHYGWVGEWGFKDILFPGFIIKYSAIDWHHFSATPYLGRIQTKLKTPEEGEELKAQPFIPPDDIENNPRYRFLISQLIFGYERGIDVCGCKTLYTYLALLTNHLAQRSKVVDNKYENKAWYVGFTLGKLCKAGDWSFDINYQYVEAQAVPDFDGAGIGRGALTGILVSDAWVRFMSGSNPKRPLARGYANFKGFQMSGLYALTDTLSFRAKAQWSRPINTTIGSDARFKEFELSVIYAF